MASESPTRMRVDARLVHRAGGGEVVGGDERDRLAPRCLSRNVRTVVLGRSSRGGSADRALIATPSGARGRGAFGIARRSGRGGGERAAPSSVPVRDPDPGDGRLQPACSTSPVLAAPTGRRPEKTVTRLITGDHAVTRALWAARGEVVGIPVEPLCAPCGKAAEWVSTSAWPSAAGGLWRGERGGEGSPWGILWMRAGRRDACPEHAVDKLGR